MALDTRAHINWWPDLWFPPINLWSIWNRENIMKIKQIQISSCHQCHYLSTDVYRNTWYCNNPATSLKNIQGDTTIPEWCQLPNATGETNEN